MSSSQFEDFEREIIQKEETITKKTRKGCLNALMIIFIILFSLVFLLFM